MDCFYLRNLRVSVVIEVDGNVGIDYDFIPAERIFPEQTYQFRQSRQMGICFGPDGGNVSIHESPFFLE